MAQKTILVVDDEPFLRTMYTRVLSTNGYKVLQANGKESALKLVKDLEDQKQTLDLIVSDRNMENENSGAELCKELKGKYNCILISSHYFCNENMEQDKKDTGVLATLNKPVSIDDFRKTIDTLLTRLSP